MHILFHHDPHSHHHHHYDSEQGYLLHELKHKEYENYEELVDSLLKESKKRNKQHKKILALHIQGNASFFFKKHVEAINFYEQAITLAQSTDNHMAFAMIGFDLIHACQHKHLWNKIFPLLNEINQVYHKVDLIEEKIYCLIQLSNYQRLFGNLDEAYKNLNLAKNLHDTMEECSLAEHHCMHHYSIRRALALLSKKSLNIDKALEISKNVVAMLDHADTHVLCENNKMYFKISCHIIMAECYFEQKDREKSIIITDHLRKYADKTKNKIIKSQYNIIRMEHELLFENRQFDSKSWIENIDYLFNHGINEFCLEQSLRVLKKLLQDNQLSLHERLVDNYTHLLEIMSKNMSDQLASHFLNSYEFKPAISLNNSTQYHVKKFIEIGQELLCEHNLEDLANKILQFVMALSKMDRGFVRLYDAKFSQAITATSKISSELLNDDSSHLSSCLKLSQKVMETGRPFVKIPRTTIDLFHLCDQNNELLKIINTNSLMILPLRAGHKEMGVIYLDSKSKNILPKDEDIEILESLVSLIANIVHNASHFAVKKSQHKHCSHNVTSTDESEKYDFDKFIGISEKKGNLIAVLKQALDSNATISLTGESGVGKEMIAKMVHYNSKRKHKPFVAINCSAIPEALLESELFGHVKGAFTDANENKIGLFERADKGTIFLDEIGEMPLSMQVKILRVLQDREVVPVGGATLKKIDVHILCATNRNLEEMVNKGLFREDLYYRISVIKVHVPSLKDRKEDIPLLVDHALRMYGDENDLPSKTISHQAMMYLMNYSWPGNVRELINVMYNLSIFVDKPCIELTDLEERQDLFRAPVNTIDNIKQRSDLNTLSEQIDAHEISLAEAKQEFERMQLKRALEIYNGQVTSASYHLQMPRPQVSRLLKKYDINKTDYKAGLIDDKKS
ncbi:MAG: sigma 54-interacting transcriptional regulator [bacterium]|nr:sigma 54-interacting transcriptional regulator [bacterium]